MVSTVLFDMDGTLIDTEKIYRICWPAALKALGYHMTDEQALSMRSLGRPFAIAWLKELFGDELDYNEVRAKRNEIMSEYISRHGIEAKPGAERLLSFLKENGIKSAVVTATAIERTEEYLKRLGLIDYFDSVISASMVKEGKPSPDVYLYACKRLGVAPWDSLAVEDAPNGILSAWRAGCRVVMVPDQTEPDEELTKKLYARVDSLDDLVKLIRREA